MVLHSETDTELFGPTGTLHGGKSVQKCQSQSRGNGDSIGSACLEVSKFICLKNVQLLNVQHAGASLLSTTSMVTVTS